MGPIISLAFLFMLAKIFVWAFKEAQDQEENKQKEEASRNTEEVSSGVRLDKIKEAEKNAKLIRDKNIYRSSGQKKKARKSPSKKDQVKIKVSLEKKKNREPNFDYKKPQKKKNNQGLTRKEKKKMIIYHEIMSPPLAKRK